MTKKQKEQLSRIRWELKIGTPITEIAKKEKMKSRLVLAYTFLRLSRDELIEMNDE